MNTLIIGNRSGNRDSAQLARLLKRVYLQLPENAPNTDDVKGELRSVVIRLERTCTERACPTCHSTYYNFEDPSE